MLNDWNCHFESDVISTNLYSIAFGWDLIFQWIFNVQYAKFGSVSHWRWLLKLIHLGVLIPFTFFFFHNLLQIGKVYRYLYPILVYPTEYYFIPFNIIFFLWLGAILFSAPSVEIQNSQSYLVVPVRIFREKLLITIH